MIAPSSLGVSLHGSGKADAHSIRIPAQKLQVTVFDNRAVDLQIGCARLLQTQTSLRGVVSVRQLFSR